MISSLPLVLTKFPLAKGIVAEPLAKMSFSFILVYGLTIYYSDLLHATLKSISESMLASDSSSEDFISFISPYAAARNECHGPGASLSASSWGRCPHRPILLLEFLVPSGWEQLQRKWLCAGLSFLRAGCAEVPTRASGDFLLSFLPLPPLPALQLSQIRRFHEAL